MGRPLERLARLPALLGERRLTHSELDPATTAARRRRRLLRRDPDYDFLSRRWWLGRVDARPLALFRIAFALLLLKDAAFHFHLATPFYSDRGFVPFSFVESTQARGLRLSLAEQLVEPWHAQLLFALWIVVLVALLLGWRTQWAIVANFLIVLTIHERDVWVLNGGDTMIRLLAFWSLFIPLGAVWSLDARRRGPSDAFALPVRTAQLQIGLVYLFSFLLKLEGETWRAGHAVREALFLRSHTLPSGDWFVTHAPDALLAVLSWQTLATEAAFVLLVFSPYLQPWLRAVGLAAGAGLHLAIAGLMSIDNFSAVMLVSYLLLLDRRWLDRFSRSPRVAQGIVLHRRDLLTALAVVPALVLVAWWNVATLEVNGRRVVGFPPGVLGETVQATGLWQAWNLFSPQPLTDDGWITAVGSFEDGRKVDLLTGKPETAEMQRWLIGPDMRWKKYESYLAGDGGRPLLFNLAGSYCREHRMQPRGERLATIRIRWWHRATPAWGEQPGDYEPLVLWRHWCFAEYRDEALSDVRT